MFTGVGKNTELDKNQTNNTITACTKTIIPNVLLLNTLFGRKIFLSSFMVLLLLKKNESKVFTLWIR